MSEALDIAAELCRRFEGVRLRPYTCPAGIATIGIGATFYLDGRKVQLTDPPISAETADRLLLAMLERIYMPAAKACCPAAEGPALAALTDFAMNLGCARLKGSTLRRKFNAGDMDGAKAELLKWTRAGGRILPGLVKRRQAEAALL